MEEVESPQFPIILINLRNRPQRGLPGGPIQAEGVPPKHVILSWLARSHGCRRKVWWRFSATKRVAEARLPSVHNGADPSATVCTVSQVCSCSTFTGCPDLSSHPGATVPPLTEPERLGELGASRCSAVPPLSALRDPPPDAFPSSLFPSSSLVYFSHGLVVHISP